MRLFGISNLKPANPFPSLDKPFDFKPVVTYLKSNKNQQKAYEKAQGNLFKNHKNFDKKA